MMKITTWIIHLAPIGVCFLVAQQLIEKTDLAEEFRKLAWYFLTVLLGLGIHGFIVLPLLFTIVTRRLPFRSEINCYLNFLNKCKCGFQVHQKHAGGDYHGLGHRFQLRHPPRDHELPRGEEQSRPQDIQICPAHRSYDQHGALAILTLYYRVV